MSGLPVGLVLRVDEYLTSLSQELGVIGLDRRHAPEQGRAPDDAGMAQCIEVVLRALSLFLPFRSDLRAQSEKAFERGEESFGFEMLMPPDAASAATVLDEALREIQLHSAEGRILLPRLDPDATVTLYEILGEAARQGRGADVELEERQPERLADAPLTGSAATRPPRTAGRTFAWRLESATEARWFVVETLRSWDLDKVAQRAELPTAELVANALLHSAEEIAVVVRAEPGSVLVEVHDCSPAPPTLRRRGTEADSGRGLLLVDALVDRWGYDDDSRLAKRVWFEMAQGAGRRHPTGT